MDRTRIPKAVQQNVYEKYLGKIVELDNRAKCAGRAVILDSYLGDAHFESQVEQQPS
jgi:hypothetical protein